MASLEAFVTKIKPAMEVFLRAPSQKSLATLQQELQQFQWLEMKIFHVQILLPLLLKLEELSEESQGLRTGVINCIRTVTASLYLKDVKGLRTMLIILLKQIRDCNNAAMRPHLSEEIKLATVLCMTEALQRATSDVLELFYTNQSSMLLGQLLLTLVEFIEREKYRKLVLSAMECLTVVFYVHDTADAMDVVLRNQVANTLFIFLPKIITVLFKTSLGDEKLGETLKSRAIRSLGRVLCVMFEETDTAVVRTCYDASDFKKLLDEMVDGSTKTSTNADFFGKKGKLEEMEERVKRMQGDGRSAQWYEATACKLRPIFVQTSILRAHQSVCIRQEYAQMCCSLMRQCALHLQCNFVFMLESVVAMSEDEDTSVRSLCQKSLQQIQHNDSTESIFDENCELLFDEHLAKLPRIINRCDETEQYAEFMFLKGFLRHLSAARLQLLLAVPKNLDMFGMCILATVDLKTSNDMLFEEYALRQVEETDFAVCAKLNWRQYKHLSSTRCIETVQEICHILGKMQGLNRVLFEHFLELLAQQHAAMNEIMLILLWLATGEAAAERSRLELVQLLLEELLDDKHWHLALQPDKVWRLKVDKPTDWFMDHTPGLYESAIEIRTQDYDSDDEQDEEAMHSCNRVTIGDAQFNVLHTCLTLDALAHSATLLGEKFDRYVFRSLHRVLLKVANSNSIVYQAATYALVCTQRALHLSKTSQLIEIHTDYLTYHLNTILKRSPESQAAVDILTVVLQFSTRNALPHLDSIFQTIREECAKAYQTENINSYLRVFDAFLAHVGRWQSVSDSAVNDIPMQVDAMQETDDLLAGWLSILQRTPFAEETVNVDTTAAAGEDEEESEDQTAQAAELKPSLPRHIEMVKSILQQVLKFVSSSDKSQQILALECLNSGVSLLKDYEDELLPLVHMTWQPMVEKFRQRDALVLNRCFTLLSTLATHAKEFILKRSLDDIMPFLRQFLREASQRSALETQKAQTQEFKLQLKLLQEFPNLIQSMEIDGRHLNELAEVISLYLSQVQPKQFQQLAVQFFTVMRLYNGPLVYLTVLKRSHLKDYKDNVAKVLEEFGLR